MATINQQAAPLSILGVIASPFSLVIDFTSFVDEFGNEQPWSDLSNPVVVVNDMYGNTIPGSSPTIVSPVDYELFISFSAAQTSLISNAQGARWALQATVASVAAQTLVAGTLTFVPPTYPGASTNTSADLAVSLGSATVDLNVTISGGGSGTGIVDITSNDGSIVVSSNAGPATDLSALAIAQAASVNAVNVSEIFASEAASAAQAASDPLGSAAAASVNAAAVSDPLGYAAAASVGAEAYALVVAQAASVNAYGLSVPVAGTTMTGPLILSGAPTTGLQAATKAYVDASITGLAIKNPVNLATAASLPANAYNNGTAGVGATLTATANGALTVDNVAVALNNRILVQNEAANAHNGIYSVTATGGSGAEYVLTRTTDMNTGGTSPSEFTQAYAFVLSGSVNAGAGFVCTTAGSVNVGTTGITFTQFASNTNYSAGPGLLLTGSQFSLPTEGTSGTYGSATQIPALTTDAYGRVTGVTPITINYDPQGAAAAASVNAVVVAVSQAATNAASVYVPRTGGSVQLIDGTAAHPAMTFSDGTTGLFRATPFGVPAIGFVTAGTELLQLQSNLLYPISNGTFSLGSSLNQFLSLYAAVHLANNGTPSAPSYTFTGDRGTGLQLVSAGQLGISAASVSIATATSSGLALLQTPTAPTAAASVNSTQIATTAFVFTASHAASVSAAAVSDPLGYASAASIAAISVSEVYTNVQSASVEAYSLSVAKAASVNAVAVATSTNIDGGNAYT